MKTPQNGNSKLETIISLILIAGVVASLVLTVVGLFFYHSYGQFNINLDNPAVFIHGQNFFSFIWDTVRGGNGQPSSLFWITLGVVILILTPYIRVIASFLFFAFTKDTKYVFITLFVLVALTISLLLH
jgi:uncharacterized membrane protein